MLDQVLCDTEQDETAQHVPVAQNIGNGLTLQGPASGERWCQGAVQGK